MGKKTLGQFNILRNVAMGKAIPGVNSTEFSSDGCSIVCWKEFSRNLEKSGENN